MSEPYDFVIPGDNRWETVSVHLLIGCYALDTGRLERGSLEVSRQRRLVPGGTHPLSTDERWVDARTGLSVSVSFDPDAEDSGATVNCAARHYRFYPDDGELDRLGLSARPRAKPQRAARRGRWQATMALGPQGAF